MLVLLFKSSSRYIYGYTYTAYNDLIFDYLTDLVSLLNACSVSTTVFFTKLITLAMIMQLNL